MHDTRGWQQACLSFIRPDDAIGAIIYLVLFVAAAVLVRLDRQFAAAGHGAAPNQRSTFA